MSHSKSMRYHKGCIGPVRPSQPISAIVLPEPQTAAL
jgi:hypothetical protein